jgi:hypothetical protein
MRRGVAAALIAVGKPAWVMVASRGPLSDGNRQRSICRSLSGEQQIFDATTGFILRKAQWREDSLFRLIDSMSGAARIPRSRPAHSAATAQPSRPTMWIDRLDVDWRRWRLTS